MNYLDILPDDVIEIINQKVCTQIYEKKQERKQRRIKKRKEKKRKAI